MVSLLERGVGQLSIFQLSGCSSAHPCMERHPSSTATLAPSASSGLVQKAYLCVRHSQLNDLKLWRLSFYDLLLTLLVNVISESGKSLLEVIFLIAQNLRSFH